MATGEARTGGLPLQTRCSDHKCSSTTSSSIRMAASHDDAEDHSLGIGVLYREPKIVEVLAPW